MAEIKQYNGRSAIIIDGKVCPPSFMTIRTRSNIGKDITPDKLVFMCYGSQSCADPTETKILDGVCFLFEGVCFKMLVFCNYLTSYLRPRPSHLQEPCGSSRACF